MVWFYEYLGCVNVIVVIGFFGVGKFMFINVFVMVLCRLGDVVVIFVVDLFSLLLGGVVLGDCIWMGEYFDDCYVFICLIVFCGYFGGLFLIVLVIFDVVDVVGWLIIILEMVGVG